MNQYVGIFLYDDLPVNVRQLPSVDPDQMKRPISRPRLWKSYKKAGDRLAVGQVFIDDFIDILLIYIRIPDPFGVNDQHRTFVTAVQATGRVDAHPALAA